MPLTREQRVCLARVLSWSRSNGWQHSAYPNTRRTIDGNTHIAFDAADNELAIYDNRGPDTRGLWALVTVESPEVAIDVLAALGYVPAEMAPMAGRALIVGLSRSCSDEQTRMIYRALTDDDRHGYLSTYCQHGLHDDCKRTCKVCGSPCLCDACDHQRGTYVSEPLPIVPGAGTQEDDTFDGPASFTTAGQVFSDWTNGVIAAPRAAELLSQLAHEGLIVSVDYHDEVCGAQLGYGAPVTGPNLATSLGGRW